MEFPEDLFTYIFIDLSIVLEAIFMYLSVNEQRSSMNVSYNNLCSQVLLEHGTLETDNASELLFD